MDSWLRFHPVDPAVTLPGDVVAGLSDRLSRAFPDAAAIEVRRWETTQLVDNGANLDRVICPTCNEEVDGWSDLMDDAWDGDGFDDLSIVTPCCGTATTLDQLVYEWPLGFARYALDVREPGSNWFTPHRPVPEAAVELLTDLVHLTGHRIGIVWRHL